MIQLEQQQHGEFVCGGGGADTNYLYPARWGWIKNNNHLVITFFDGSSNGMNVRLDSPSISRAPFALLYTNN